jgi:hypothetical protein
MDELAGQYRCIRSWEDVIKNELWDSITAGQYDNQPTSEPCSPCALGLHLIDEHSSLAGMLSWVPEMTIVLCHCHVVSECSYMCFLNVYWTSYVVSH